MWAGDYDVDLQVYRSFLNMISGLKVKIIFDLHLQI